MVFASLHTIENEVSSIAAGGGTFTNSKSEPNTKNTMMNATREPSRPTYDPNDAQSVLKALIRYVMRTFYDVPKSLVIEYIYYHHEINQQELALRLCLEPKEVRSYIQDFKRDHFIVESLRLELQEGTSGRRNQDQYYYRIDMEKFINIVKYRLHLMRIQVEKLERDQTCRQANYRCKGCRKEYTVFDMAKLFNHESDALICTHCNEIVAEDVESKEDSNNQPHQQVNMVLFNEQMKTLFEILEKIDQFHRDEEQARNAAAADRFSNNPNNPNENHSSRNSASAGHHNRSQGSSMFERTSQVKHDIEIIIEKEDDEYDTQMDIDETSNAESTISSSRGNGKLNKKTAKPNGSGGQSGNDNGDSKSKSSSKKAACEPKPMPIWFTLPTVHVEEDPNEHQIMHSSSQPQINSSVLSRQLSNQKLPKSITVQDIKQMLLVNESRGKKPLSSLTADDSMSPPTPNQVVKLRSNSTLGLNMQPKSNSGAAGSNTDDDDPSMSLFHTVNEDSVHHMDIDM